MFHLSFLKKFFGEIEICMLLKLLHMKQSVNFSKNLKTYKRCKKVFELFENNFNLKNFPEKTFNNESKKTIKIKIMYLSSDTCNCDKKINF